mgnify:CR=1 FL=1|jgi:hypothetical protein
MSEAPQTQTKALQWGKDILVILVIPALLWIVKLETGNAQRDLIIQQAQSEVTRLEVRFSEIEEIDDRVQQNALHLARLEGKIDTANGRLDEIRSILLER